jgi:DNA-directed RNA polymerase subunit L
MSVIHKNTTTLNNEIIKHRLGGIPIYHLHTLPEDYIGNLIMELNVENTTPQYVMVTTRDFKIKTKSDNKYLSTEEVVKIFPPSKIVMDAFGIESYTDIVNLRPKLPDMPADKLHLTCEFSWGAAYQDSNYNVVCTCAYSHLRDEEAVQVAYNKKKEELSTTSMTPSEIEFKLRDWMLLDSYRYVIPTDFNFIIETVGVYSNKEILINAIDIILHTLHIIEEYIEITLGDEATEYKILINKDDYTIGKLIENAMYYRFFELDKVLTFVGFKKAHPHDTYATIRVHYATPIGESYKTTIIPI